MKPSYRSNFRGHEIEWRGTNFYYVDSGKLVKNNWYKIPCGNCDKFLTEDGHDGCLGTLPGVMNACCGHGDVEEAYIQFLDGNTISGESAVIILEELKMYQVEKDA